MTVLAIDFETYSDADLKKVGTAAYAEDPSTGVHCAVFKLVDAKQLLNSYTWIPALTAGLPPPWVVSALRTYRLMAHNTAFEQCIYDYVLRHWMMGWPDISLASWIDTVAVAAALSLPTTLEGFGKWLGAEIQKDKEGHALMLSMCKGPSDDAAKLRRLARYCEIDVDSMVECWRRAGAPLRHEYELQYVDRKINTRGVQLDLEYADAMRLMAQRRAVQLNLESVDLSEGELLKLSAVASTKTWIEDALIQLPSVRRANGTVSTSLDKRAVSELLLPTELPDDVRGLLKLREEASRMTSLAKLARVPLMVNADGRLRFAMRYHGAHTGRWTSSGLQIHNLPKAPKDLAKKLPQLRAAVMDGDLDGALAICPDLLTALSQSLRSVICAAPGKELIGGDYSAIEARVLAWLAGQQDLLDLFVSGADVYVHAARRIDSDDRQLGKVQVLALGYGMGDIRFAATAASYGIELSLFRARQVRRQWRENNPKIVEFWRCLEDAFNAAIERPGEPVRVGLLTFLADKQCLCIQLPSGRKLRYWRPHRKDVVRRIEVVNDYGEIVRKDVEMVELRYWTPSADRRNMDLDSTYGGKLAENVTQAVARDLLANALDTLSRTSYDVVMHVHDSIASEVPKGYGSVEEFCRHMADLPSWAEGLPLAVEGYRASHFKG